jgi:hypothetical protein
VSGPASINESLILPVWCCGWITVCSQSDLAIRESVTMFGQPQIQRGVDPPLVTMPDSGRCFANFYITDETA